MAVELDIPALRISRPADVAKLLKSFTNTNADISDVTSHINEAVAKGALPAIVLTIWIGVARKTNPTVLVSGMVQTHSVSVRYTALKAFVKAMRSEQSFKPVWIALGGAEGLAKLMAQSSVDEVDFLCRRIGQTAGAQNNRDTRQRCITDLLGRLAYTKNAPSNVAMDGYHDRRPLRHLYKRLVIASSEETINAYEDSEKPTWAESHDEILWRIYTKKYEAKFLDEVFDPKKYIRIGSSFRIVYRPRFAFVERILAVIAETESSSMFSVPDDLTSSIIMPQLKRLSKKRKHRGAFIKFFGLIIECFEKHKSLADKALHTPRMPSVSIFGYGLERWNRSKGSETELWSGYMERLLRLMPDGIITGLFWVEHRMMEVHESKRFTLLCMILRCSKYFQVDIERRSKEDIERLNKDVLWPVTMFTKTLDKHNALELFSWLSEVQLGGLFMKLDRNAHRPRVWHQACGRGTWVEEDRADPEIIGCVLERAAGKAKAVSTWLKNAGEAITERKKKAERSREPADRAFWARSALLLSIAAGDLDRYLEEIVWAQRFVKDPLAIPELVDKKTVMTKDGICLLSALPVGKRHPWAKDLESLKANLEAANGAIIQIMETYIAGVREPSFQERVWYDCLRLPGEVVKHRVKKAEKFQNQANLTDGQMADLVWKPTIDMLLDAEALLRSEKRANFEWSAVSTVSSLGSLAPKLNVIVLADLVSYLMAKMKEKLETKHLRQQIQDLMHLIRLLAHSDQPSLAIPFVRDIILNGDDNSSWHREIMNVGFLSSLSADVARSFLQTMAKAVIEKLQDQNSWQMVERGAAESDGKAAKTPKKSSPTIKVTTVKMIAQLLSGATFINPATACDILVNLLPHGRHVDIAIAIVESLLSILKEPSSSMKMRNQVLECLEEYAVPIAARLCDRYYNTEQTWEDATKDGAAMPAIDPDNKMMTVLLNAATVSSWNEDEHISDRLSAICVTAMDRSANNHRRWIKIFLENNGRRGYREEDMEDLPVAPVNVDKFSDFAFTFAQHITKDTFDLLKRVTLINLNPTDLVAKMNFKIRYDKRLATSDAGKHWLSHYNNPESATHRRLDKCIEHVSYPHDATFKSKVDNPVTTETMTDFIVETAEVMIHKGLIPRFENEIVNSIDVSWTKRNSDLIQWKSNVLPLLRRLHDLVVSLRTEEWQKDPYRKPASLPDPLRLRCAMLPMPTGSNFHSCGEDEIEAFVKEVAALVEETATKRTAYHRDWAVIKSAVADTPRNVEYWRFGLAFGRLVDVRLEEPFLEDLLYLELARTFLKREFDTARKFSSDLVVDMLEEWRRSTVEEIREAAVWFLENPQSKMGEASESVSARTPVAKRSLFIKVPDSH